MSNPESATAGEREKISAMFASLVMQQTNMASIFLGRVPHPESGKVEVDLENARYFIDQLEMLEAKTRGNLEKNEEALLRHSLTTLRLAFVEAVSRNEQPASNAEVPPAAATPAPETAAAPSEPATAPPSPDDSKKRFTKKY